jgi:hypothetical protein
MPSSRAAIIARLAMSTGGWPATIGLHLGLLAEDRELFLRGRALGVQRRHQHALLLALGQAQGDLRGRRRLARALQADHQDHDRGRRVQVDAGLADRVHAARALAAAQRADELVMDDLDDHLARRDRAQHVLADRLFADLGDEGLDRRQGHVGLEQRQADLAQHLVDVAGGQRRALAQPLQYLA